MSNIKFVFFREPSWEVASEAAPCEMEFYQMKTGQFLQGKAVELKARSLICVGYTVDAEGVASIAVHKLGKLGRVMGKQIVTGKILVGKTFEIVTVPHRLEQSIILGAKYFLLTRERA